MDAAATFAAALALASVQVLPRFLRRLHGANRSRWLSAGGGVAVAFVFLELLPKLIGAREPVAETIGPLEREDGVFLLALVGLLAFYGIELLARRRHRHSERAETWIDYVAIGMFSVYYALIGYLLWEQLEGAAWSTLVLYTAAMGIHFLVVDYGLSVHHRASYAHAGRWMLSAAVIVGWALGAFVAVPEWIEGFLLGLLAGAIVLVALKEELPFERGGNFWAFAAGIVAYTVLLLSI